MNRAFATVIFGLAASLCWGSGDFNGGLASRRANASSVVIAAYAVGFLLLAALALVRPDAGTYSIDIVRARLAGASGALGAISSYSARPVRRTGVAPAIS